MASLGWQSFDSDFLVNDGEEHFTGYEARFHDFYGNTVTGHAETPERAAWVAAIEAVGV